MTRPAASAGSNHLCHVLRARRVEQERVSHGIERLPIGRHQQLADLVAERRAAGFARQEDVVPASAQGRGEARRLKGLAAPIGPLDREESAPRLRT